MSIRLPDAENRVGPEPANDSWRAWLTTGVRKPPVDRRRVRGSYRGLKRMLVEGTGDMGDRPHSWKTFSGTMVRQAVDEAVCSLPMQQRQLIKLAYFGGLSNREIAERTGLTVAGVRRGLRQALDRVSEVVERGHAAGRRTLYGIALVLGGRWLGVAHQTSVSGAGQVVRAGMLIVLAGTAGAVLAADPPAPGPLPGAQAATVPAVASTQPYATVQHRVVVAIPRAAGALVTVAGARPASHIASVTVNVAPPALPVAIPWPVSLPPPPVSPGILHGALGA